ncbi:hypothetical protein I6I68_03775 [Corynebacterium glucuronolyticum]|uniref:hypothetical protein n=1 Tax=Corynebacterium glucuronolyticum TaxID=39791 RepID=UPI00192024B3|nr:hypothetical protein [Corynebacterium glucuronolyticum]QQU89092.1 hypothetical protein I6I68_03775 [Corynebacterium glucuronolyticum]
MIKPAEFEVKLGCLVDWLFPDGLSYFRNTVVVSLVAVIFLRAIYSIIKTQWPGAYGQLEDRAQERWREHPFSTYLAFRIVPVAVVVLFSAVILDRGMGDAKFAVTFIVFVYLELTSFRVIGEQVLLRVHNHWLVILCCYLVDVLVISATSTAVFSLRESLSPIVPSLNDLWLGLWGGLFGAISVFVFRDMLTSPMMSTNEKMQVIRKDIGSLNLQYIYEKEYIFPEEQRFVEAFLIAEAEQRPRWFRWLERKLGGIFLHRGTYGVAQVASDVPLSDRASIDKLVEIIEADKDLLNAVFSKGVPGDEFETLCVKLTSDPEHIQRVYKYWELLG